MMTHPSVVQILFSNVGLNKIQVHSCTIFLDIVQLILSRSASCTRFINATIQCNIYSSRLD